MNDTRRNAGVLSLFKGAYVWSGIVMALGGYLAEEFTGGGHAFEFLMLFGGLNLGMGLMRNIWVRDAERSGTEPRSRRPSDGS